MNKNSKIYVAGHRGLVGSAICKKLKEKGYINIIKRTHQELDLLNQTDVNRFFEIEQPEYIFLAAAKVGGIGANSKYPADFIYQNTMIGFNLIHAAFIYKAKKLMNLGSSCIYPKMAKQPIKEEELLTGELEPTNDAYALAKISTIKLCTSFNKQYATNFLSVMPTNLYGPGDNYDPYNSHVLPAMIRKFHEAKISGENKVTLWGDGSPKREFLYNEDLAEAVVYLMEEKNAEDLRTPTGDFVNVGTGDELTIKQLAETIREIVYKESEKSCSIEWDISMPNGTPRKLCDITRLTNLGFTASTDLKTGITLAYKDFLQRNLK